MHKSISYSALSAVTTAGRQSLSIFTATKAMHAAVVGFSTVYGALVWQQGKYVQDCSNKLFQKSVLRDCISMCFDVCTINIRVSIRARGLDLVFYQVGSDSCPDRAQN